MKSFLFDACWLWRWLAIYSYRQIDCTRISNVTDDPFDLVSLRITSYHLRSPKIYFEAEASQRSGDLHNESLNGHRQLKLPTQPPLFSCRPERVKGGPERSEITIFKGPIGVLLKGVQKVRKWPFLGSQRGVSWEGGGNDQFWPILGVGRK